MLKRSSWKTRWLYCSSSPTCDIEAPKMALNELHLFGTHTFVWSPPLEFALVLWLTSEKQSIVEVTLHDSQALVRRIPEALQWSIPWVPWNAPWGRSQLPGKMSNKLWPPCCEDGSQPCAEECEEREPGLARHNVQATTSEGSHLGCPAPTSLDRATYRTCGQLQLAFNGSHMGNTNANHQDEPSQPIESVIRNDFIKLLHLECNRKLEHHLSIKSLKTMFLEIGNQRGQMVLKLNSYPLSRKGKCPI